MDENTRSHASASGEGSPLLLHDKPTLSIRHLSAGLLIGAGLYILIKKLFFSFGERPPIIVRGGSIVFETEDGWVDDGDHWRPRRPNAPPPGRMVGTLEDAGECLTIRGRRFDITYVEGTLPKRFTVKLAGVDPRITPKHDLRRNGQRELHHGTSGRGRITQIEARQDTSAEPGSSTPHQTCTFGANGKVTIRFESL